MGFPGHDPDRREILQRLLGGAALAAGLGGLGACGGDDGNLRVYAAVDLRPGRAVLDAFTAATGQRVHGVYDSEAAKTVGLARRLEMERDAPRADVWWSGEALYTALLARAGCLDPLGAMGASCGEPETAEGTAVPRASPSPGTSAAADVPWVSFAPRVRVLVYRRDTWPADLPLPTRVRDLEHPRLAGRVVLARPTSGTSATHAAVLLSKHDGEARLRRLRRGARLVPGNAHVVQAVVRGQAWVGITDTDDVLQAWSETPSLELVVPDQGPDEDGCVLIPCTAALVRGAPQGHAGGALVRFLAGADAERVLRAHQPGHLSVHDESRADLSPRSPGLPRSSGGFPSLPALETLVRTSYSVTALAERWEETRRSLEEIFE